MHVGWLGCVVDGDEYSRVGWLDCWVYAFATGGKWRVYTFFFFFKAVMSTVTRVCKSFRRQGIERCNDIREISRNLLTINTL